MIFQTYIFGFHVSFRGCIQSFILANSINTLQVDPRSVDIPRYIAPFPDVATYETTFGPWRLCLKYTFSHESHGFSGKMTPKFWKETNILKGTEYNIGDTDPFFSITEPWWEEGKGPSQSGKPKDSTLGIGDDGRDVTLGNVTRGFFWRENHGSSLPRGVQQL